MLTFQQLDKRIKGLIEDLDGDLWRTILAELNPPDEFPKAQSVHDLCFRDAKALAGYVPDLRAIMKAASPKSLSPQELEALKSLKGLFNFSARLPVMLLTLQDYKDHQNLIDVYNGYRQTLKEIDDYLLLTQ
ncbi:MAG: hypothetical protein LBT62_03265 [Deltaproteobacteria bacterium]|jgi:hypothetical protein|nr:hypothetical protein [Deltaproteobacteria bacterium]